MKPRVGTVVHVQEYDFIKCRAAMVTGLDYDPLTMYVAVYRNRGDVVDRSVITDETHWHTIEDCPEYLASENDASNAHVTRDL